MTDHISICVCMFSRDKMLERLLRSLKNQDTGGLGLVSSLKSGVFDRLRLPFDLKWKGSGSDRAFSKESIKLPAARIGTRVQPPQERYGTRTDCSPCWA